MSNGFVQGTTHVTYFKKKGKSRNRRNCIYYSGNGNCGTTSSCMGSAHCTMYITQEEYDKKQKKDLVHQQKQAAKAKKEASLKSKRNKNR